MAASTLPCDRSLLALVLSFGYCLIFCGGVAFVSWSFFSRRFLAASGGGVLLASALGFVWNGRLYGESLMAAALRLTFEALGLARPAVPTYLPPVAIHGGQVMEAVVVAFCSALGLALALAICFYQNYRYRRLEEMVRQVDLGDAGYRLHLSPAAKVLAADPVAPAPRELAVLEPELSLEDRVGMQLFIQREQKARESRPVEAPPKYRPRFSPPLSRMPHKAS
jgi:hypothetical protein